MPLNKLTNMSALLTGGLDRPTMMDMVQGKRRERRLDELEEFKAGVEDRRVNEYATAGEYTRFKELKAQDVLSKAPDISQATNGEEMVRLTHEKYNYLIDNGMYDEASKFIRDSVDRIKMSQGGTGTVGEEALTAQAAKNRAIANVQQLYADYYTANPKTARPKALSPDELGVVSEVIDQSENKPWYHFGMSGMSDEQKTVIGAMALTHMEIMRAQNQQIDLKTATEAVLKQIAEGSVPTTEMPNRMPQAPAVPSGGGGLPPGWGE